MARDFTAASSHTVNYGDIGDLGTNKITLACWVYPDSFTSAWGIINKRNSATSANAYSMGMGYTSTTRWELQLGNAANTAVGAAYYATRSEAAGAWYHVCMTYDGSLSAGSRCAIYINGSSKAVTASTDADVTPGNAASDLVLGRVNNTGSFYFDGRMAEPSIWDVALSADEVAALAKRYSPDRIRPASLAFYDDLVRNLRDIMTGTVPSSSTAVIDHPPIIRRRRAQIFVPKVAAGGGATGSFAGILGAVAASSATAARSASVYATAGSMSQSSVSKSISVGLSAIAGSVGSASGTKSASAGISAISGLLGALETAGVGSTDFNSIAGALVSITHTTARLSTIEGKIGARGSVAGLRRAISSLQAIAGAVASIEGPPDDNRVSSFAAIAGAAAALSKTTARIAELAARAGALGTNTAATIRAAQLAAIAGLRAAIAGINVDTAARLLTVSVSAAAAYHCTATARAAYNCTVSEAIVQ